MTFEIPIVVTQRLVFRVEAESEDEAKEFALDKFHDGSDPDSFEEQFCAEEAQ